MQHIEFTAPDTDRRRSAMTAADPREAAEGSMEHHGPSLMDSRPSLANEPSVRALREAMQAQLAETPPTNVCSPELTKAIRALCVEARTRGLRAEELVLLFKSTWASLSAAGREPIDPRRAELLERAISLCIKSYYATAD